MKKQVFRYYKGEENIVVVEKDNYEESLFREQYVQALKQVTDHVEHPKDNIPNLIAFCGDRGEGKTSCMMTINHIITTIHEEHIAKEIANLGVDVNKIKETEFATIPIIDPAFFDKEHNIIELLLGHLYKKFKDWSKNEENQNQYGSTNEVAKLFQKTKTCLMHIEQAKVSMYDPLEELEVLAAGVELSECISKLIEKYLGLIGKKKLLICIDDIDLNMSRAYRMCEEIRKYLNNRHCLILMSVKIDQLIQAIENDIHKDADYPKEIDFSGMAARYVAKLIPVSVRVNMPQAYDLCDYRLEVYEGNRKDGQLVFSSQSVKNGVVRKIFATSRFLFYNSKGSVSAIVPNNLRSLTQQLALLFSMRDIDDVRNDEVSGVLENNKHLFKVYLFKSWVKQLGSKNQKYLTGLTDRQDGNDLNKYVVNYLAEQVKKIKGNNALIDDIAESSNYGYNISVGDVLYLVSFLEQRSIDEELKKMLFFIKSFYSIRLFEKYDIITNNIIQELYPETEDTGNLYLYDARFEHTNALQRFVSGSYFTYSPNDLLAPARTDESRQSRDYKVINGKKAFNDLLSNVQKIIRDGGLEIMPTVEIEKFQLKFRLAEYFILTITRSILERDVRRGYLQVNRKSTDPYYLTSFNINTGYYVYDVLAPFYAMTNPQYAYERFKDIGDIYDYALNNEWSLLRKMMCAVREKEMEENDIKEEERKNYYPIEKNIIHWTHRLLSNAVIRNAEIAGALMENCRYRKPMLRKSGESRVLIASFYRSIIKSNMMTYNRSENEKPYYINFDFLKPIVELLNDEKIDNEITIGIGNNKYILPSFRQIYETIEDKKIKTKAGYLLIPELFAPSFKRYRDTHGNKIIERIKKNQPELYQKVSSSEWKNMFDADAIYTKDQAFDILQGHIFDFVMADVSEDDEL